MTQVLCVGEAMVEFAPMDGAAYGLSFAGDTFNTAWYLARLRPEWQVSFLSSIGQDALSDRFVAFAEASGVGTSHLIRHPARALGAYMIELQDAERSFHYWRGQSAARTLAADVAALESAFAANETVFFSGITLAILEGQGRDSLLAALAKARAAGAKVVFDPNMRRRLWPNVDVMCGAIMQGAAIADIVLPSFDEDSAAFGDAEPAQTIARYLSAGASGVAVKQGPGAVHYAIGQETGSLMPEPATHVVDTTAAGDSFNAGFLAALLAGASVPDAVGHACALSRKVIGGRGALVT